MAQASSSNTQLAYIAETVFGVTPDTPNTQLLEYVDFTGNLNAAALEDPSITPSRQQSYSRRGNVMSEGALNVILCPDNYDDFLESALMGTWTTNVLKVGSTRKSFAIEQGFKDLTQFRVFNGMVVNTLNVAINTEGLVTTSFGFMGKSTTAFSGTSIDATPTSVSSKDKFFHENGTFKEGGSTVGYLSSIDFTLTNNYTATYALGSTSVRDLTAGQVAITGTVTALFENVTFYNKFINNTESELEFTLTAGSPAETLTFNLPRVKYTAADLPIPGNSQPINVTMQFSAIYDSTDATSLTITRSA